MAKKKIKADPAENDAEIAGWERRFPTKGFEIVNGKLVEIPVPVAPQVAPPKKRR